MCSKVGVASAALVLGACVAAAQAPSAPRDLEFQTRELTFETLDLVFPVEDIGAQVKKTVPPPAPLFSAPPPPTEAPIAPAVVAGAAEPPPTAPVAVAPKAPTAPLGRRVALVIGNAGYKVGPLRNPGNDAAAVAAALDKKLGFDKVILKQDLGFDAFRTALREFAREAIGADIGVVYFAGHGTEVNGRNFLIPIDAKLARAGDLELEAVALDTVLNQLTGVMTLKLVILDACRNNVFPLTDAQRTVRRGLALIEPEDNVLVVYAAKHGTTAADGAGRRNSPFTEALLKHIATRREIRPLLGYVRDDVMAATGRAQQPFIYGTLGGREYYLLRP